MFVFYVGIPVAQTVEQSARNIMGMLELLKCIPFMQYKSLWIKDLVKCINVHITAFMVGL